MANGPLDLRIQPTFPISGVAQLLAQRPGREEQIRESQQRQELAPLQLALQAAQVGSQLATQGIERAKARVSLADREEQRQAIQELSDLSLRAQGPTTQVSAFGRQPPQRIPAPGAVPTGRAQPQLTPQQFQQQALGPATRLQPGIAAQTAIQRAQPPTPITPFQQKGFEIEREKITSRERIAAAGRQAAAAKPKQIPAELLKQEVELKSTLADIGTIEQELKSLPAGFFKGGIPSLSASITGGFLNPQVKAYNDNLNQRAVRFYRATTKDTRLSDFDARKSALPMMPKLTDSRPTQLLKTQSLRLTAEENLSLVTQAQKKAQDPTEVIRVQNIARNRLRNRGKIIERIAKFNAQNPNKTIPLTIDTVLQLEKQLGL